VLLLRGAWTRLATGRGTDAPSFVALALFLLALLLVLEAVRALRADPNRSPASA
jgi:hypothetical protein